MAAALTQQTITLYESLKKDLESPTADVQKCGTYLNSLKKNLAKLSFLQPQSTPDVKVLELGAHWSIRAKDIPAFERFISQLKTYYNDYNTILPPSQRMHKYLGLNLLRLLAQNRISEFHTELEVIEPEQLSANIYIKHPIQVEQCLMEGSYNKVWNSRLNVPAEEYLFFIDILMGTIRNEIASCSEKAYNSLPLPDAATLLYFKTPSDVVPFAHERGWTIAEGKIIFTTANTENVELPTSKLIRQTLGYARELERIANFAQFNIVPNKE
ncbi:COP9 signalosome [Chytridium lagenaria]|nr:COP9 signalosome [Chytridium lagenaria]